MLASDNSEIERIRREYQKRDAWKFGSKLNDYFNPAFILITQEREREILNFLSKQKHSDLSDKVILDVGCGTGEQLQRFVHYGAKPANLLGIDLAEERIKLAKERFPNVDFRVGNIENLPFEDKQIDIIIQFTCFSSVFDTEVRRNMAKEMLRVLKNDGLILWYDLRPRKLLYALVGTMKKMISKKERKLDFTPTKPIRQREIRRLFPDCAIECKSIGLYLPLVSLFRRFLLVTMALNKLFFLRTHYIARIRKR